MSRYQPNFNKNVRICLISPSSPSIQEVGHSFQAEKGGHDGAQVGEARAHRVRLVHPCPRAPRKVPSLRARAPWHEGGSTAPPSSMLSLMPPCAPSWAPSLASRPRDAGPPRVAPSGRQGSDLVTWVPVRHSSSPNSASLPLRAVRESPPASLPACCDLWPARRGPQTDPCERVCGCLARSAGCQGHGTHWLQAGRCGTSVGPLEEGGSAMGSRGALSRLLEALWLVALATVTNLSHFSIPDPVWQ